MCVAHASETCMTDDCLCVIAVTSKHSEQKGGDQELTFVAAWYLERSLLTIALFNLCQD